jgi:hypothetical protein
MTTITEAPIRELDRDDRYRVAPHGPELVRVPELTFIMVDGHGDPNTSEAYREALQALYSLSYTLKFAIKAELGQAYRVGALEGLWWADDLDAFSLERKGEYRWTAMIAQPESVTAERFAHARDDVRRRKGIPGLDLARLERFEEGLAAQILHVGPFSAEGPTIARLHAYIAEVGGTFDGHHQKHHELYLSDPRRAAPEKWRTIIRQSFRPG